MNAEQQEDFEQDQEDFEQSRRISNTASYCTRESSSVISDLFMQGMLLVLWLLRESVCGALLDENEQETMNDPTILT